MEKQTYQIQVEDFKMEEAVVGQDQTTEEQLQKRKDLLEKLQLKEQQKMFAEDVGIPYQRLTTVGRNIWGAFCPYKAKLADFKGYIPTRVLEIIETNQIKFGRIEVWSEEETNPDPVLVGIVGQDYTTTQAYYLIARWGESLLSYAEVVKIARDKWTNRRRNKLMAKIKEAEKDVATLERDADEHFDGRFVSEVY